jgi:glycosyltransferase involved in cell wall biosynthesis
MTARTYPVFMVGAFPPPVHGMAVVNEAVCKQLERIGIPIEGINIAAPSLDRSISARVARLPNALRGMLRFAIRAHRGEILYMSVSGGFGQLYELLFLLLARLRGVRIFLHHHSFTYLDQRKALTTLLVSVAGLDATHITQSDGMAAKLRCTYHQAKRVVAISNAVLLLEEAGSSVIQHQALAKIGFLGNISAEKGLFEFLAVAEKMEGIDKSVRAVLAGPFQDSKIERLVRERLTGLGSVDYVGPKYGQNKAAFFREIDVLLFPTRNDAEPLTIHEAMMHGVPVIAYGRGTIGEIVFPGCGLVIDPAQDFVDRAVAQLQVWKDSPQALQQASKAARERFLEICGENKERWESVRAELCG